MRLATYDHFGSPRSGVVLDDDWVVDTERAHLSAVTERTGRSLTPAERALVGSDLKEILAGGEPALTAVREAVEYVRGQLGDAAALHTAGVVVARDGLRFLPPVPNPDKIICVGRNYLAHAQEAGLETTPVPELFTKFSNALIGDGAPVPMPKNSDQLDWEVELALVIGKPARDVSAADAYDYVAGYTILNDVSARNLQQATSQFLAGKTQERSTPVGPWLVTPDEIADPQKLRLKLDVDGETMQDASTDSMVHSIVDIIAFASSITTLEPGDVIATGTPEGVGLGRSPVRYLRAGETMTLEIEGIGVLRNTVR